MSTAVATVRGLAVTRTTRRLSGRLGPVGSWASKLRRSHWLLWLLTLGLCATGVIFIYGTAQAAGGQMADYWLRQLVWIAIGLALALGLALTDYARLGQATSLIFPGSLFLLILVLIVGREINGAKSWLPLGPFNLQPAEFAKLALVIVLAQLASQPWVQLQRFSHSLPFIGLTALPFILIGLQPDLGSALVLLPVTMGIMIIRGFPWRWVCYLALAAALLAPVVYHFGLREHQKERLQTFMDPNRDPHGGGWNARQSLLAVGSGGLWGKGYMQGTQNILGFLPRAVAPSDFIFSVIAEETGFVGGGLLILVLTAILLLCLRIAATARDELGRYLAVGITVLLGIHGFINIGMSMGVAPIIGIPLPFVSYGGSFMLMCLCCAGILQSVHLHRHLPAP